MKTKKAPLAVGDRVRVYGWVNMHHSPYKPRYGGPARVTYVDDAGNAHAEFDDEPGTHYTVHPKQCRRLKRREKKQPERKQTFWLRMPNGETPCGYQDRREAEEEAKKRGATVLRVLEIREGECIVSREKLAEAWDSPGFVASRGDNFALSSKSLCFESLCKALGLGERLGSIVHYTEIKGIKYVTLLFHLEALDQLSETQKERDDFQHQAIRRRTAIRKLEEENLRLRGLLKEAKQWVQMQAERSPSALALVDRIGAALSPAEKEAGGEGK